MQAGKKKLFAGTEQNDDGAKGCSKFTTCHVTRSEGNTRTFHLSPPPSLKIEEEFVSEREIDSF
jgi:hypothetical protein